MGSCVDSSGGSSEHLLKEEVGLLWFMTGDNLGGLAVNLLSNDKLGQLKKFEQPVDLRIFLSDALSVELLT